MRHEETGGGLFDPCGRRIDYLRLSVTDRCNLRCFYCLPKDFHDFQARAHWLSFVEIERVVAAFAYLGVSKVRLTGGEPLVRSGLPLLAARLAALPGVQDLSLSTNGSLLSRQAQALRASGITRLNVSLDTLRPERFERITGGGRLAPVIDGLLAAKRAGFAPIKLNMLALRGINDDEFEDMVEFCLEHDFTLRFIETMPIGSAGLAAGKHFLGVQQVKEQLQRRFDFIPGVMPGGGPARYVQVRGTDLRIGFITPMTQHFCATCNRVRLAVDGTLYLCLGHDARYELRPLLRDGASDAELRAAIRQALTRKPARHDFSAPSAQGLRFMSMTGG